MGPTGRHGLLAAPLVSQNTKFPPGYSARHQKAYVFLPLPPCRELLIVYGDHIARILVYARIPTIADPTASSLGIKPKLTAVERHALTN
eukprot:1901571-Ditylum_brightwellii.AAC.1